MGIRFEYDSDERPGDDLAAVEGSGKQADIPQPPLVEMPDAITSKWWEHLRQATLEGDLGWLKELVTEIEIENPALAKALAGHIELFEFDKILDLYRQNR